MVKKIYTYVNKKIMIKLILTISVAAVLTSCNSENKKTDKMEEQKKDSTHTASANDTTPKVTGVGGIFFYTENPKETREWYKKNLGLDANDYGCTFESRDVNKPTEINSLQWSPFKTGSAYFAPSKKEFMINYRVQNIEGLIKNLKAQGVTVLDSIEPSEFGKFVHILDPEGNKIELWEPASETKPLP